MSTKTQRYNPVYVKVKNPNPELMTSVEEAKMVVDDEGKFVMFTAYEELRKDKESLLLNPDGGHCRCCNHISCFDCQNYNRWERK